MNRVIIIAGWAYATEDLSALCSLLTTKYNVQVTSTTKLFSMANSISQSLPPASQYAKALYKVISKSEQPPTVIAWSMGALVAIEAIVKLQIKINRLILISGTSKFCADIDYPHGIPEKYLRAMIAGLIAQPEKTLTTFIRNASFPRTDNRNDTDNRVRKALSLPAGCLSDGLAYLRHTDLRRELSKIQVPTLIIHGKQDKIIPFPAGEFLHDNITDSHLIVHDNAGHSLIFDHPNLIADNIRVFLEA